MNDKEIDTNVLLLNLDKIHTTELGENRIKRNLNLEVDDIVKWCKEKIENKNANIVRKGKNFYISIDDIEITVNANSYTIITAHKLKGNLRKDNKVIKESGYSIKH